MSEHAASKQASGSYRPKGYGMSVGLQRARRRFFLRNLATGVAVASFAVSVWAYSISAVKQDVFDDVDEQARALNAVQVHPPLLPQGSTPLASLTNGDATSFPLGPYSHPRGLVIAALGGRCPWLFDPIYKTLVWGAPPVGQIGRIEDKVINFWKD